MINIKIPIHLYSVNKEYLNSIANEYRDDISALWIEITDEKDIERIKEIQSYPFIEIVPVIKNPSLIRDVTKISIAGIAINQAYTENLFSFKDLIIKKNLNIYLYRNELDQDDGTSCDVTSCDVSSCEVPLMDEISRMIDEISSSVLKLKSKGIKNIFLHIYHPNPVIHFNINKLLKGHLQASHVISLTPIRKKEKNIVVNSLSLGSLFYERIGDLLLIRLLNEWQYKGKNLDETIELVKNILGSLKLFPQGYTIISCPVCGRCQMDLLPIAEKIDRRLKKLAAKYKQENKRLEDAGGIVVAVMGCNVNGPGEAQDADIGIAGGRNKTGTIFKNGKAIKTVAEDEIVNEMLLGIKDIIDKRFEQKTAAS